jgi:hypothetical protein
VLKRSGYILIVLSFLIIQAHSIFAHTHDHRHPTKTEASEHNHHSIFTDVDFEEHYNVEAGNHFSYNTIPTGFTFISFTVALPKKWIITYEDHPPPKPDVFFSSLRAPPSC